MAINSDALKAFLEITQNGTFTKAAAVLGMTQSALSQKIAKLEDQLETTLLIRGLDGITLTPSGEKLLTHARQQLQLEAEFLRSFQANNNTLSGHLRIAGYSSIMRSLVIPKLAPWLRENTAISVEFSSHEIPELQGILKANKADLVITDYAPNLPAVEQLQMGEEEYVLIESKQFKNVPEVYLDNYVLDNATEAFFSYQGLSFGARRSYMGDCYGILAGVSLGLGRAVMSRHLVEGDSRFRVIKSNKRYLRPIIINYFKQSYYPAIQLEARRILHSSPRAKHTTLIP
ncbi:MAG TPA: LysR family transcriptional regulator [Bacteriovoracaceae bacterium]|nr:LysR family transcriptional regulator [Bacteriovoracaceae bacterium]